MCIIAYKPKGIDFMKEWEDIIDECFFSNPDGAGVMWIESGKVFWKKGFFELKNLLTYIKKLKKRINLKETEFAVHCRIATHGKISPAYCHPFPVIDNPKELKKTKGATNLVCMHNGMISGFGSSVSYSSSTYDYHWTSKKKSKKNKVATGSLSDTMDFVKTVVYPTRELLLRKDNQAILTMYEKIIERDRFLIFSSDGRVWRLGIWESYKGWYFSNDGYKPYKLQDHFEPLALSEPAGYGMCPYCGRPRDLYKSKIFGEVCKECYYNLNDWGDIEEDLYE